MAVFTHIETDTGTNADISSATAIGAYTATADKLVMVDVSIDQVAGDGDYVMYVTRQINGAGSAYRLLPQTTLTAASGVTAIAAQSGWITVKSGDVLTCYVDGLAGDTSTPDWTTRWFEDSGTITGVTLADDSITAAKFDESTAFPLKSADTGTTAIARTGADSDTLETLSNQMDTAQTDLDNPSQYKADVSALALKADLQDVENKVDLIDVTTVANGGKIDAVNTKVSAIDTDTVMSFMIDGFTFEQIVQIMASVLAGKLTRSGDTLTFRDLADTVNRVVAETDANKQRTAMTYTV